MSSLLCPVLRPILRPLFRGLEPDCQHYPVVIQPGGTIEDDAPGPVHEPTIMCGVNKDSDDGDLGFPITYRIELGTALGTVEVHWNTVGSPNKFVVHLAGAEILNTGYVGPAGQQANLDARLAYHGLPSEPLVVTSGSGHTDFVKTMAEPTVAYVTVYAPGPPGSDDWNFTVVCPDGIYPPL